ncbi:MAG TPA: lysylphosphatidylglycerol synthase transmembrane domain-containing protein [Burkholderiaceae bacterium]|jgi:uncharacterized membrane protein YbhN (UPF0104 family)|nr:lysylphosphatidylglycerol synthase transmembrane domain-containing protein [Burkholderiaceae bacterium]
MTDAPAAPSPLSAAGGPRGRPRWIIVASVSAGLLFLGLLAAYTPWRLLATRVASVPWPGWVAAVVGMSLTYALRAGRLRVEWAWKLAGLGLGYRECLQVTLLHNAAINVLPMRSGEASYAWLLHRRWGVGLGDAAASLLWLRLQDMMVLGVLGLAALVPWPLPARLALAAVAVTLAATAAPALVRLVHVRARWARARAHVDRAVAWRRRAWHVVAKVAGAFRASRGGARAWGYAIANWGLKLGIVGTLLASLAGLPLAPAFRGALGGELAGVVPIQAPAGVGTYEAGVALGARVRLDHEGSASAAAPATSATVDNPRLIFGAALAVHALMVVVALGTAFTYSLVLRPRKAPGPTA